MKQYKKRKCEATREEAKFEKLLSENGYEVVGVREFTTLTDYLIRKGNVELEWRMPREPKLNGEGMFKQMVECFRLKEMFLALEGGNKNE